MLLSIFLSNVQFCDINHREARNFITRTISSLGWSPFPPNLSNQERKCFPNLNAEQFLWDEPGEKCTQLLTTFSFVNIGENIRPKNPEISDRLTSTQNHFHLPYISSIAVFWDSQHIHMEMSLSTHSCHIFLTFQTLPLVQEPWDPNPESPHFSTGNTFSGCDIY